MKATSTLFLAGLASAVAAADRASRSACPLDSPSSFASVGSAETKYMISFGDSYSQTGFNLAGSKPSADNPIGNPPLPGWTASGGSGWVSFATTKYNNGLLLSYNLAYGGATTAADLVRPFEPQVLSFEDQVGLFNTHLKSRPSWAPWSANDTLVVVWMGVNDVGNTFWGSNTQQLYEEIMVRYFSQLQALYDAGVRQFALLSAPPLWRAPSLITQKQTATSEAGVGIALYNDLITKHLEAFKAANTDAETWFVDTMKPFDEALDNPTRYGAPDALCYNGDGTSCLWFNDYHPAVAIQGLVAEELAKTVGEPFFKA